MYRIKNSEYNYRKRNNHIIISHIRNLWETGSYISPSILIGTHRFTYNQWLNYFHKELLMKALPFHYFVELLNKDYVIYKGCPQVKRSSYLHLLSDSGVIRYKYKDAILIVIQEDFNLDTPEDRMVKHLCDKLVCDLMREYSIRPEKVKKLDDILEDDWKEQIEKNRLRYDIRPMRLFNMDNFRFIMNKYIKG
jgi:hypothetical protein